MARHARLDLVRGDDGGRNFAGGLSGFFSNKGERGANQQTTQREKAIGAFHCFAGMAKDEESVAWNESLVDLSWGD